MKAFSECLSLTFLNYTIICQLDFRTPTATFTLTNRSRTSLSMLFRSRLIEQAQPKGVDHPTWGDLCNTHASSSPLSGTNSRHPQLNSSIRQTLTVLPLSCKVTNLHIKPYVASNWSNYFHSKVFSKLLMTATIGSQPSCEKKKRSSTYYGTFVSLGP